MLPSPVSDKFAAASAFARYIKGNSTPSDVTAHVSDVKGTTKNGPATTVKPRSSKLPALGSIIKNNMTQSSYKLISVIGKGAFSTVFLAHCLVPPMKNDSISSQQTLTQDSSYIQTLSKVAIKCIAKQSTSDSAIELQRQECQVLQELHEAWDVSIKKSIVGLYESIETEDFLFMVMEYCPTDLYQAIVQTEGFPHDVVRKIFAEIADSVQQCHDLGVYHRDLKPENILVDVHPNLFTKESCPKKFGIRIADFGLATKDFWSTEFRCGSLRYMSPECYGISKSLLSNNGNMLRPPVKNHRGRYVSMLEVPQPYSAMKNDVWSLGVILINLIFARNPWHSPEDPACLEKYLRRREPLFCGEAENGPKMSASLNTILRGCFDPNPISRLSITQLKNLVLSIPHFFEPECALSKDDIFRDIALMKSSYNIQLAVSKLYQHQAVIGEATITAGSRPPQRRMTTCNVVTIKSDVKSSVTTSQKDKLISISEHIKDPDAIHPTNENKNQAQNSTDADNMDIDQETQKYSAYQKNDIKSYRKIMESPAADIPTTSTLRRRITAPARPSILKKPREQLHLHIPHQPFAHNVKAAGASAVQMAEIMSLASEASALERIDSDGINPFAESRLPHISSSQVHQTTPRCTKEMSSFADIAVLQVQDINGHESPDFIHSGLTTPSIQSGLSTPSTASSHQRSYFCEFDHINHDATHFEPVGKSWENSYKEALEKAGYSKLYHQRLPYPTKAESHAKLTGIAGVEKVMDECVKQIHSLKINDGHDVTVTDSLLGCYMY